jgi:hypothetical protein
MNGFCAVATGNVIMLIKELCTYTNVEPILTEISQKKAQSSLVEREWGRGGREGGREEERERRACAHETKILNSARTAPNAACYTWSTDSRMPSGTCSSNLEL